MFHVYGVFLGLIKPIDLNKLIHKYNRTKRKRKIYACTHKCLQVHRSTSTVQHPKYVMSSWTTEHPTSTFNCSFLNKSRTRACLICMLTSFMANKDVSMIQIFHFFCVILSVGSVGSSISWFCPTNFCESFCMYFKWLHTNLPGDFNNNSSWDGVPAGENRDIAVI